MSLGYTIFIAIAFFWAGFVCAISFMEAWLKFKAKGVTLAIGLSIGKRIFKALNRVEWVLLSIFTFALFYYFELRFNNSVFLILLLFIILIIQTFYLLPRLNKRADLIMEGQKVERSYTHVQYISIEFLKVIILLLAAFWV